jgi:hypothetical protein
MAQEVSLPSLPSMSLTQLCAMPQEVSLHPFSLIHVPHSGFLPCLSM